MKINYVLFGKTKRNPNVQIVIYDNGEIKRQEQIYFCCNPKMYKGKQVLTTSNDLSNKSR